METVVLYPHTEDGVTTVAILIPAANCGLTLEQIIAKDIPAGTPYKIIAYSDLPDLMFQNSWEWED